MRRPAVLLATAAAGLALPAAATADVYIQVPRPLLGGPIASPLPALTPSGVVAGPGRPSRAPGGAVRCTGAIAGDCVVWGPLADVEPAPVPLPGPGGLGVAPDDGAGVETDPPPDADTPEPEAAVESQARPRPIPAVAPTPAELAQAFGGLVSPAASDWLAWQRTTLRWRAAPRATDYNVQVFRGRRRVLNAWSKDTRLRVPPGVLKQGRTYVWVVWPANGPRGEARFALPVGRSTFAVTLRPRIVFRGGGARATRAEVRPHIPFGTLRLRAPRDLRSRVPQVVTIDRRGRFTLPISKQAAQRLDAVLADRGLRPPVGLRGPGRS